MNSEVRLSTLSPFNAAYLSSLPVLGTVGIRWIDSEYECCNFDCFPDVHPENLNIGVAEKIVGCWLLLGGGG